MIITIERVRELTPLVWTFTPPVDPWWAQPSDVDDWNEFEDFSNGNSFANFESVLNQPQLQSIHTNAPAVVNCRLGHFGCVWGFGYACVSVVEMRGHIRCDFPPHLPHV